MTAWRYILASLQQFGRVHAAVAAGVAVSTLVITGALLVGDSMRGSLRDLAIRGLGRVDSVLIAEQPFRTALVDQIRAEQKQNRNIAEILPLLLTQGAATARTDDNAVRRATGLTVYGVTPEFWGLAAENEKATVPVSGGNEIALTESVARELGVKAGDYVVLRIPLAGATPADSVLGEKEDASASRRLKVVAVLPADPNATTMARFTLRPTQQEPRNAFVPLATLQQLLELEDKANAAVVAAASVDPPAAVTSAIASALSDIRPDLADFGITVDPVSLRPAPAPDYVRVSADRLVLDPDLVAQAEQLYGGAGLQPVVTYLANTIAAGDRKIPYSTVAGVDSAPRLGPILDDAANPIALADDEVALNDWAAADLQAKVGDEITLTYYEPETTHGELREAPPLRLKLRAIVPLADAAGNPTAAADPHFAPELPGVTDQASIESWKLPFELVETVRDEDEQYWDERRTTPKAFVSFNLASRLWSTRWGTVSVVRLPLPREGRPNPEPFDASVRTALKSKLRPDAMGMTIIPAKRQALAAASGTTPFDGLFLGFSFFLMASAVMLTALLFRLGIEQRAREIGLLLAAGLAPRRVRRLLAAEGALVAAVGAAIGAVAGVAYAAVMIHGLNTWWVDATAAPFLRLHVTPRSIVIGMLSGLAVAIITIAWSLRRFARLPARQLLAGDAQPPLALRPAARWSTVWLPAACLAAAVALGAAAIRWEGESQAGAFFAGGALALVGVLAAVRGKLREAAPRAPASYSLAQLAVGNARRNPSRTMLALALAATASFLIVALSAFRLAPTERGTGGFETIATADLPLHYDLASPEGRSQLGFSGDASRQLADANIVSFRVRDGEDASCLNLYKPTQPRILGAPPELADRSHFQWAATTAPPSPAPPESKIQNPKSKIPSRSDPSPWRLLEANLGADAGGHPIVPMVLDRNTAFYSLKLYAVGDQLKIREAAGQDVTLQIVGLLANSILQGDVVISETNFLRLFPEVAGRRFFLLGHSEVRDPQAFPLPPSDLSELLETQLEDFGVDAVDARERLAQLLAVQNTYLSTFQTLGALGLVLGAVGLAVVQLRSILERRGELALMQAAGFGRRRLAHMVLAENLVLLLGGLGIGCAAALAAVLPHAAIEQVAAPWRTLAVLLAIVAIAGAAAGWLAARAALRAPLIPALRGE